MMVRRYIVKDMPEAVSLIRNDLGNDAVILSTKRVRVKKWLGLWRSPRIEVMAAAGTDIPMRAPNQQFKEIARELEKMSHKSQSQGPGPLGGSKSQFASSGEQSIPATAPGFEARLSTETNSTVSMPASLTSRVHHGDVPYTELSRLTSSASTEVASAVSSDKYIISSPDTGNAVTELADLKRRLGETNDPSMNRKSLGLSGPYVPSEMEKSVIQRLHQQGVNSTITEWIQMELHQQFHHGVLTEERTARGFLYANEDSHSTEKVHTVQEQVTEMLLKKFSSFLVAEPISKNSHVVAFVGPTGVGKTTTIAKLAALHVLTGSRSVGLITADTFRIGAVEQLKTYATILNVPLEVVKEGDSVQTAIQRLSHCDLIFIDTAGRNYFDFECFQSIQRLLAEVAVDETYLVLSLTSKTEDLELLASLFHRMKIDKFLFTKRDETSSYGVILNLVMNYNKKLSYLSTGQNVPDDIEIASLENIVRNVVGGTV